MKTIHRIRIAALTIAIGMISGCNSWLDLLPENSQSSDQFWNTKEDVEAVMNSCYMGLRDNLERFLQWGELRGDGLTPSTNATDNESAVKALQLEPTNAICNWSNLYKVIGRANAVLKYAPRVKEIDPTFETSYLNALVAEATIVRAHCYFYLVRVFGDVPLVLEPYVDDKYEFITPKTTETEVLQRIKKDLNEVMAWARPQFGTVWETKGRASRWAAYALLADICLWTEDYAGCVEACNKIIESKNFSLLPSLDWLSIFAEGNTREGIFELQWDYETDRTSNSLYAWLYQSPRYALSPHVYLSFREKEPNYFDERGYLSTYSDGLNIWKYAGLSHEATDLRDGLHRDANWIFYRYADVLLMKAEALIMQAKGDVNTYKEAEQLIMDIRERAGYARLSEVASYTESEMLLNVLMPERCREFVAEGKRWFDVLRAAKRENYKYKQYLIETQLEVVSAQNRPIYESKLQDPLGYYFPIYQNEIDQNPLLVQNPYYEQ
jgi:hypothetical protein